MTKRCEGVDDISRETAIEIIKRIEAAFSRLSEAGKALHPILENDQYRIFARAFGAAIVELDLGVLEIVYRCYPDLRPTNMPRAPTLRQIEECSQGSCRIDQSKEPSQGGSPIEPH
jgi:hypothetical protein